MPAKSKAQSYSMQEMPHTGKKRVPKRAKGKAATQAAKSCAMPMWAEKPTPATRSKRK